MTKPLTIFLELVGGVTFLLGIPDPTIMFIGGLMFVFGWIGTRKRTRDDRK